MARDYKHRIPAYRRTRRGSGLRHKTGLVALAAGLLAAGAYFLTGSQEDPPVSPSATVSVPPPPPRAEAAAPAKPNPPPSPSPKDTPQNDGKTAPIPEPRFTFYKILAEKEVIIPESEIKTLKREESLGKKPPAGTYLVQAGSYTSQQEAEKVKAQLARLKVKAKLEMIKLENTAWYRVKIGPYASLADADKVRQYLRSHQIDSVVQRTKP
ncbi:SPOR domain-containing protein [Candidatus Methylocalor cossyra]|uniref:Sporulation related domain-containing protein n=1 Tax=Candidatus Methylocalor cossyra TaxID=3108543 RepID=A0ABM9NID1_9GAMM